MRIENSNKRKPLKQRLIHASFQALVWIGAIVLYYVVTSFFFDTPVEYQLRRSTALMREEYERLEERYDTLHRVLDNIAERDRNVFGLLFESTPSDFDSENEAQRLTAYEELLGRSDRKLRIELNERLDLMEKNTTKLADSYVGLQALMEKAGEGKNSIPAIQPVLNKQLTLLTASYGMRLHPFYGTLESHQGVDYTVPEGSRVFATADGRVRSISELSTAGKTIVIDHGNGYETYYAHLARINVQKGQQVRRGDIIALSGDTGLSLAPHLHYEVRLDGMRVDPIHYFFMELSPTEYQRLMHIAQSGMQAFD